MRITNADYTPLDVLAELIVPRGVKLNDTQEFFSGERSSHEWLVEAWAQKLEVVLESFKRYGTEVAETQFIRDHGVDVRMNYLNKDQNEERIGFQIKSNQEADRDSERKKGGKESLIATIKRQAFEADHHAGVAEWWVVSCFDSVKHKRLVSAINAEVTSGKQGSLKIRHVTPREAMAFLKMDEYEIDAVCTLLLCKDDEVLKLARRELHGLGRGAQNIVLNFLVPALEGEREISFDRIDSFSECDEDDGDLSTHIDELERIGFLDHDYQETFKVEPSIFVGLCALYFEARARHGLGQSSANRFLARMTQDR